MSTGHSPPSGYVSSSSTSSSASTSTPPLLTPHEQDLIADTQVNDYLFTWCDPSDSQRDQAVVLGLLSMANHSETPNTAPRSLVSAQQMEWVTLRDIAAGEELTFRYRCELWFQPSNT